MRAAIWMLIAVTVSGCGLLPGGGESDAAASDAQASADAELTGCAATVPAARSVSAELDTLYANRRNNVPLQYTPISDALIELHDALESDPDATPESASQIRDDIAEIDGLPTGGSATTMMDFVLWALGPAASSDAVISRCVSDPASDAGADRRAEFLDEQ